MTSSSSLIKKPVLRHLGKDSSFTSSILRHALSDVMSIQYTCTNLLNLLGHEATRQEYDSMLKGMQVNCNRCLILKKNAETKVLHPLAQVYSR